VFIDLFESIIVLIDLLLRIVGFRDHCYYRYVREDDCDDKSIGKDHCVYRSIG